MHDKTKGFEEKFKSKNAAPPRVVNGTKQQRTARTKRLMGAPLEFWAEVCRLTRGRTTLVVAMYIYRRVQVCGSRTVTLPVGELVELGIARQNKQKALINLETVRLIKVVNARGQTARVTLLWQEG